MRGQVYLQTSPFIYMHPSVEFFPSSSATHLHNAVRTDSDQGAVRLHLRRDVVLVVAAVQGHQHGLQALRGLPHLLDHLGVGGVALQEVLEGGAKCEQKGLFCTCWITLGSVL